MLKRFRQELIFIPLMMILIEVIRRVVYHFYPDTAMFDRGSELETYLTRLWQITWITCGTWVLLRVSFPSVHKALREFYSDFDNKPTPERHSVAIKFFFCFFFGLILLMSGRAATAPDIRHRLVDTLHAQLHVREATGHNDGVDVERYLSFVGQKAGASWCAAFVSYNLHAVGVPTPPNPQTAWSPAFANKKYIVWSPGLQKQYKGSPPQPGDCFTLFSPELKRVGHTGFIVGTEGNYFITIEGNTGTGGIREGSGVHKYKRAMIKVYAVTDFISQFNHEKTIHSINPVYSNRLRSKAYGKHRKVKRENVYCLRQTRYNHSARHNYTDKVRYFGYYSDGYAGHSGKDQPAGTYNEFASLESFSQNNKRPSGSTGCMQGTGRKSTAARASDYRAYCNCEGCKKRAGCHAHYYGAVYTEMG